MSKNSIQQRIIMRLETLQGEAKFAAEICREDPLAGDAMAQEETVKDIAEEISFLKAHAQPAAPPE